MDEPRSGAANMARDHALAVSSAQGTGTLRFYRWAPATLSFGRNEPVTVGYRKLLRDRPELGVVRRPTGGRAVIHDRELTYAAVFPVRSMGGLREAYGRINAGLVEGLRRLGVDARSAPGDPAPGAPGAGPCFLGSVAGEVVVGERKLVGSAQVRIGNAVLQHGSLLLEADQGLLVRDARATENGCGSLNGHASSPDGRALSNGRAFSNGSSGLPSPGGPPPVTLAELMDPVPSWDALVGTLCRGLARTLGGDWEESALTPEEAALADGLEARYGSQEWTWRR